MLNDSDSFRLEEVLYLGNSLDNVYFFLTSSNKYSLRRVEDELL